MMLFCPNIEFDDFPIDFPKDCDDMYPSHVQDAEPHVAPAYPSAMRRAFAYGFGASPHPGRGTGWVMLRTMGNDRNTMGNHHF